jgi:hypothetical protein
LPIEGMICSAMIEDDQRLSGVGVMDTVGTGDL